jgi:hypothetical protein
MGRDKLRSEGTVGEGRVSEGYLVVVLLRSNELRRRERKVEEEKQPLTANSLPQLSGESQDTIRPVKHNLGDTLSETAFLPTPSQPQFTSHHPSSFDRLFLVLHTLPSSRVLSEVLVILF